MLLNIQALRGVAALLVLMHHALPHFKVMNLSSLIFEFIASIGFVGVDIFFIISGFVMAKTTVNKTQCLGVSLNFITKRFLRIYLGFWPIFILALIYYYTYNIGQLDSKNILQSFLLINANMYDLVIPPAWSLTFELYFYIIIAILLLFVRLKAKTTFGILTLLIILKTIFINVDNKWLDFFLSPLILEFISGYFLYHYLEKVLDQKIVYVFLLMVISLCVAIYFNIGHGHIRVLTFGVFAFSIVWLFVLLEKNNVYIFNKLFQSVGDCSYTLYLIHTVLLGVFYTTGLRNYLVNSDLALIGIIVYVLFIISFSWVFYRLIERPLYQLFRDKL